jgi:hypothetical protein
MKEVVNTFGHSPTPQALRLKYLLGRRVYRPQTLSGYGREEDALFLPAVGLRLFRP